ncbi:MAG: hypothetical protein JXM69_09960 [Anaerolineae bacterium]|nr:hypothetical protein [Anaerolineae bacterium]
MSGVKGQGIEAGSRILHIANCGLRFVPPILFLLAVATLAVACRSTEAKTSPRFAVHTLRPDNTMLVQARDSGVDTMVQVFPWREIEPTRDQFHWEVTDQLVAGAEYYGLNVIARLDQHPAWASEVALSLNAPPENLDDYGRFVERVVARYRGRIHAYIIWNEPNLAIEWGGAPPDPIAFTELLQVGYEAAKAVDPDALVIAPGLAPTNSNDTQAMDERLFLAEMYRAGASAYFDVLAAHPYSFGQPPGALAGDKEHPTFNRLAELRNVMVEHGDADKPIWITEMGWTIDPPPEQPDIDVNLEQQAAYLADALDLIRREWPWVELITVWNLSIPTAGDPFGGYSLLDARGQPRPAYHAWQQAIGSRAERNSPVPQPQPQNVVQILGKNVVIHLGDSDERPPWWPLFGGRKPSLTWTGGFYLVNPGSADWTLLLEFMQLNEIGTAVTINGVSLSPDLPQQDYTRRWLTMRRTVPASLLHPGYNEFTITSVRLLPDTQHRNFVWDDFQMKNIRLVRSPD